jgi:hypothetical protein
MATDMPIVLANTPRLPIVQRAGAIVWPSFFTACVMTMVFFALIDPVELKEISALKIEVSREAGYTVGFFMFWFATASSSLFTALLLDQFEFLKSRN